MTQRQIAVRNRQEQIKQAIREGFTDREIADAHEISVSYVNLLRLGKSGTKPLARLYTGVASAPAK